MIYSYSLSRKDRSLFNNSKNINEIAPKSSRVKQETAYSTAESQNDKNHNQEKVEVKPFKIRTCSIKGGIGSVMGLEQQKSNKIQVKDLLVNQQNVQGTNRNYNFYRPTIYEKRKSLNNIIKNCETESNRDKCKEDVFAQIHILNA